MVDDGLLAGNGFWNSPSLTIDDASGCAAMELGVGRIEPLFLQVRQSRDFGHQEVAGRLEREIHLRRRLAHPLDDPAVAGPEQVTHQIKVQDDLMRTEAAEAIRAGITIESGRTFLLYGPLRLPILEIA